jgi:hypothetical protein
MAPLNMGREVGAGVRAVAGLKLSSEGKARFLETQYGPGNVHTTPKGEFYVKDQGQWIPVDSPDLNMTDAADLSGAAVAAAPAMMAGPVSIPTAMGLGLVGSGIQQGLGAITPGGDPATESERLGQTALDVGGAGLGEVVGKAISRPWQAIKNTYAKQTGIAATPVAAEGKAVEAFLGTPLSPGQISQRRSLLTMEGALRRSPTKAGDIMADMDQRQLQAARDRWETLLAKMNANPQQADLYGGQVEQAFDKTVNNALKVARSTARRDFAVLDQAAGRQPLFNMQNTVSAVDELLARYDVPGAATDASKGLVRQLGEVKEAIKSGKSALEMQRLLESWGGAAKGSDRLFPDLGAAQERGIAKRVFGALQDDLATTAAVDPTVAGALKSARDNYRTNMAAVDELKKSSIGQYLGFREQGTISPEHVADRVAGMKPSQLKQTFNLLGKADPELAGATKRHLLERAMTVAEPNEEKIAQAVGVGQTPEAYSPARLLANLAKSPVLGVLDPNEKFALQMLNSSFARMANRAGTEGSPTHPLGEAAGLITNLVTFGFAGDAMGGMKLAARVMAPTKLAEIITDPTKTRALIDLIQPNAKREAVLTAASALGLMSQSRTGDENVRPNAMLGAR